MMAIDRLAKRFEEFESQPSRGEQRAVRLPEENQILFDFCANGLSALECFCFSSYCGGVLIA